MKPDVRKRLADSVETAAALAEGLVEVEMLEGGEEPAEEGQAFDGRRSACASRTGTLVFSEKFACLTCGTSMPELEPRIFSFNSPHGACPRCTGLGSQQEIDPELVVDPTLTINEGAILPWSSGGDYYEQLAQAIADKYEIDLDTPWEDLPEEDQDLFLYGRRGRAGLRLLPQPDGPPAVVHGADRGSRAEPRAPLPRDRLGVVARADRGVHVGACPARSAGARGCGRRASRCKVGGLGIHEFTRKSAREAIAFLDELELTRLGAPDRRAGS